ncbi:hypothetical protein ASE61_15055 [Bosea sp. Root670]|uniref:hypothetical protein n=1 Tax=Bosea sp. Root670 TaxID=1736583 RepID=UPI0007122F73|nr:hypothetical protein [Bosea sp. Root670]KRE02593.1 hypothetical protein ASE61_15055 [Bosea sp. Root670]
MTPAQAIAALDRQLAQHGETVTLQRLAGAAVAQEVTVPAFVRGFAPQELVNGITQQDSKLILSPTDLSGWSSGGVDSPVPVKNNRIVIAGRVRAVEAAAGIRLGGVLVRIECTVRG